jgi:hypothetical protein
MMALSNDSVYARGIFAFSFFLYTSYVGNACLSITLHAGVIGLSCTVLELSGSTRKFMNKSFDWLSPS